MRASWPAHRLACPLKATLPPPVLSAQTGASELTNYEWSRRPAGSPPKLQAHLPQNSHDLLPTGPHAGLCVGVHVEVPSVMTGVMVMNGAHDQPRARTQRLITASFAPSSLRRRVASALMAGLASGGRT